MNETRPFFLSIRARVALAMLAPLVLGLGIAGWGALDRITASVAERENRRIASAGEALRSSPLTMSASLTRQYLEGLALVFDGNLVALDRERDEVLSTFEGKRADAFAAWARTTDLEAIVRDASPTEVNVGGEPYLALGNWVGERATFVLYPGHPVEDAVARTRRTLLLAAGGALIVAAILAVVLASLITRPLKRLAAEAAQVASGNLDRAVSVTSRDETGALAESFNRMLEGLRDYRRDLVRAERLAILGRLASSVAHELRNPLTAIRMNVQMLPGEDDAARRREDVDLLLEEIDRLERAVDELLTLARPAPLALGEVAPGDLVASTLETLRRQLDHLRVTVEVDVPEEDLPAIRADEAKLRQVLVNLLLNAAQAMPQGGAAGIEVRGTDGEVRFTVRDAGGGIPEDLAPQIFEPFVSGRDGGIGLGLAISRQIVEAHGGEISFRGIEEGTAFDVALPRTPPD